MKVKMDSAWHNVQETAMTSETSQLANGRNRIMFPVYVQVLNQ
jgi:hypothetical protein